VSGRHRARAVGQRWATLRSLARELAIVVGALSAMAAAMAAAGLLVAGVVVAAALYVTT
jgi:hypothetical protein